MDYNTTLEFCKKWLKAWTGNHPEKLIDFYGKNCYYQDPANPEGLKGKDDLYRYFEKLLAANPQWIWEVEELYTIKKGFILKWKATIPINNEELIEYGMDIVEIDNDQKIIRNEVYFDRTKFLELIKKK
jgi:hypothetical protein